MDDQTRQTYAEKSYYFLYPSDCCPYRIGNECEVTGDDVYVGDVNYYNDNCCTSNYYHRCHHFHNRVRDIEENHYFQASYSCPYLNDSVCGVRDVDMQTYNRDFYRTVCGTTDYLRRCPHFLERVRDVDTSPVVVVSDHCPNNNNGWCVTQEINVGESNHHHYHHCCNDSNYHKCCPHYWESLND